MTKIDDIINEIIKKLKKIIKNSDVFYEKFFDGSHYTIVIHIIADNFKFYFKIDETTFLNHETNLMVQGIVRSFEYNVYSEVFDTKEYLNLFKEE